MATVAKSEMSDLLDTLDWDIPSIPFSNTAQYESKIYLCDGLEKKQNHRLLLEPLLPDYNDWRLDESSSSSGEEIVPPSFHIYEGVGSGFGPGGGDPSITFQVNKELATFPAVPEIVVITEGGNEIMRIKPKGKQRRRRKVSRGCVELAVSEWMKEQRELPLGDPRKHNVRSEMRLYNIDGEIKDVAVWLWRGLEQDINKPDVFKIFL